MRLDVLEDSAVVSAVDRVVVDDIGNESVVVEDSLFAHTLVSVTVADRRGVVVFEEEVEGIHQQQGIITDDDLIAGMEVAGKAAVAGALALITPTPTTVQVPLDDRDEAVLKLTERALTGDTNAAAELAANASTSAVYNRAVVVENAGDLGAALDHYEEAARRSDAAGFAGESLAGARQRMQNLRDLGL